MLAGRAGVISPSIEMERLNSPPSALVVDGVLLSRRWRFGACATTPIEPMSAKGAATILSAAQAIM